MSMDVEDYGNQLDESYGLSDVPKLQHLYRLAASSRFTVLEMLNDESPLRLILEKAKSEADAALDKLIDADLHTDAGIATARKLQATVHRHLDLMRWVEEITTEGDEAAQTLKTAPIEDFEIQDGEPGDETYAD